MIWKIEVKSLIGHKIDSKFVYDEKSAVKAVMDYKTVHDKVDITISAFEEVSCVDADSFLAGVRRDVAVTDLLDLDSSTEFRSLAVEKLKCPSARISDVSTPWSMTDFFLGLRSSTGKSNPGNSDMAAYIGGKVLADLSVTKLSDESERKRFLSKWKTELLCLCSDPEWYDSLLSIASWRSFPKTEGVKEKWMMSCVGARIFLSGNESDEFAAALARKKAKGKTNKS